MKKFLSIISVLLITVLLFTACEYTPTATSVDTKQTLEIGISNKFIKMVGQDFVDKLMILHKADKMAK